jgi:predicted RNA-binding Zn-ribbon protein involved in translation (DUF1610 family)
MPTETPHLACPSCDHDLAGVRPRRGQLVCPGCGRASRAPSRRRRPPLPSCRCENCGYELAGLNAKNPVNPRITCPECGTPFNMTFPSRLEEWPGDRAVRRQLLGYSPYGFGCFLILAVLVWIATHGTARPAVYLVAVALALTLTMSEAVYQAWAISHRCFARKEAFEKFTQLALIAAGLTLAIWLPLFAIVSLAALLL